MSHKRKRFYLRSVFNGNYLQVQKVPECQREWNENTIYGISTTSDLDKACHIYFGDQDRCILLDPDNVGYRFSWDDKSNYVYKIKKSTTADQLAELLVINEDKDQVSLQMKNSNYKLRQSESPPNGSGWTKWGTGSDWNGNTKWELERFGL